MSRVALKKRSVNLNKFFIDYFNRFESYFSPANLQQNCVLTRCFDFFHDFRAFINISLTYSFCYYYFCDRST